MPTLPNALQPCLRRVQLARMGQPAGCLDGQAEIIRQPVLPAPERCRPGPAVEAAVEFGGAEGGRVTAAAGCRAEAPAGTVRGASDRSSTLTYRSLSPPESLSQAATSRSGCPALRLLAGFRGARGRYVAIHQGGRPGRAVTVPPVRSRSRSSDSASPSGTVASRREPACTSGRSMTASTRLARLPGGVWPEEGSSEVRTVPSEPSRGVTSAAATVSPSSLTSTRRGWSLVMAPSRARASSDADKAMPATTGVKQPGRRPVRRGHHRGRARGPAARRTTGRDQGDRQQTLG